VNDPYLEAEGQAERIGGATRQVGEQVKDAGRTSATRLTKRPRRQRPP
jgi:uncharacterized protein YjbJ (UPF0337 family)